MNALIIDAALGVVKADIGIKGGMIVGVGKAGNPDVMDGVTPGTAPASPVRPGCSPGVVEVAGCRPVCPRCNPVCVLQAW